MIHLLDRALRTLIQRVPELAHESQIRFQPPDEQWRAAVANLQVAGVPAPSLNVYLSELRQNRELRSTERRRVIENGRVVERQPPGWVECQYLISAWSPAVSEQIEPTVDEHELLYAVLAVVADNTPLNPSRIHRPASPELAGWGEFRDIDLPTEALPVEGFGKLAEFWGTMGAGHRWKPVLQLLVGLPVVRTTPVDRGPPVVTVQLAVSPSAEPDVRDVHVQIGGVLRHSNGVPVGSPATVAVVAVTDGAEVDATTSAPDTGRFLLDLPLDVVGNPARYRLRAEVDGSVAESIVDLRAPSHDIVLADEG